MRKTVFYLLICSFIFSATGCIKDEGCQNKTIQTDAGPIAAYAAANGISGTTHSSGVVYEVTIPGGGPTPTPMSTITVRYTGKLLDGTVFDSQTGTPVTFQLGGTIQGFQLALQQVQKGGTIKFLIPSSLAYGCAGTTGIPPNSILFFEVQLVDVM